jgi:hypothetical protein
MSSVAASANDLITDYSIMASIIINKAVVELRPIVTRK